ncbi:MAG: xanthine dehydrogenase accessory protein XdhC [Cognaticolwellia sp.]
MMITNWSRACDKLSKQGQAYVLVTLVGVSGSTPRNSGSKMVISHDDIFDSIGGGHLEYKALKFGQKMLAQGKYAQQLEHFQLGSQLGQCCGGNATVLFECFAATGVNIMVFGAGHVAKALVPILAQLPCKITWVDSRAEQFPASSKSSDSCKNVEKVVSEAPEHEVSRMPENSYFIVMTHNHQMDFEISHAILQRADFHYLGLIASNTKWRCFQQRFKHREIDTKQVARMHCPIGLTQVPGKLPMEIAVSVSAEIINIYQVQQAKMHQQDKALAQNSLSNVALSSPVKMRPSSQQGIHWQEFKQLAQADKS